MNNFVKFDKIYAATLVFNFQCRILIMSLYLHIFYILQHCLVNYNY